MAKIPEHSCRCGQDHGNDIIRANDYRPDIRLLKKILTFPPTSQELGLQQGLAQIDIPEARRSFLVLWTKEKGNNLFAAGEHRKAIEKYEDAIKMIFDGKPGYICTTYYNPAYIRALKPQPCWTLHLDLVSCCNNIAQAYLKTNEPDKALDWLQELQIMYECDELNFEQETAGGSKTERLRAVEYYIYRIKALLRLVHIFSQLRNSGAAAYHVDQSYLYQIFMPDGHDPLEVKLLGEQNKAVKSFQLRNPDLSFAGEWDVEYPLLQIRGIWSEVHLQLRIRPRSRRNCCSWIWRSKLYVFGGERNEDRVYKFGLFDIWCLDLTKMDRWRILPEPTRDYHPLALNAKKAIVYQDCAWIFNGHRHILRFNMIKEIWDVVATSCPGKKWPYEKNEVVDPCIALYDRYIYVFGGDQHRYTYGSDLFMVLDLQSLKWRNLEGQLSGDHSENSETKRPLLRRAAACWVEPDLKRFYIMLGSCNTSISEGDPDKLYYYADIWSYSIEEELWTRERIRGNYPSPRDEMAIVYHKALNAVITFGGVNDNLPSHAPPSMTMDVRANTEYTVYGDTFIMDASLRTWRQVITRSFPCWRAGAHCLVDDATGQIYLFGGSCFKDFINCEYNSGPDSYFFNDVWRLDLQLPGLSFNDTLFYQKSSFLKYGKWRRCYTCANIGKGYFKCKGSCGGKYIFCSIKCQRTAWRVHRGLHGCRKF